jgi:hypothetical protein
VLITKTRLNGTAALRITIVPWPILAVYKPQSKILAGFVGCGSTALSKQASRNVHALRAAGGVLLKSDCNSRSETHFNDRIE